MALIARFAFDDEDTPLHAHFTARAHRLEETDLEEWARVLGALATELETYAERVRAARARITVVLDERSERDGAMRRG